MRGWNKKMRPVDTFLNKQQTIYIVSQNPGQPVSAGYSYRSPLEQWADGSTYSPQDGYTWPWPGGGSGHTQPQNPTLTFAQAQSPPFTNNLITKSSWSWNNDMFAIFSRGLNAESPQPNVSLDRTWTASAFIYPLGWDPVGNVPTVLGYAEADFNEHDTYPAQVSPGIQTNFTASYFSSYSSEAIGPFNGVRFSLVTSSPYYPAGSGPDSGYFVAASVGATLYFALYSPILDVTRGIA